MMKKIFIVVAVLFVAGSSAASLLLSAAGFVTPALLIAALPVVYLMSAFYHEQSHYAKTRQHSVSRFFGDMSNTQEALVFIVLAAIAVVVPFFGVNSITTTLSITATVLLGACSPRLVVNAIKRRIAGYIDTTPDQFGDEIVSRLDKKFAKHEDALVAGRLEEHSKKAYPASKFPELYSDIPADIRRPIIIDGRLITGERLTHLVPRRLSIATVTDLYNMLLAKSAAMSAASIVFGVLLATTVFSFAKTLVNEYVSMAAQIDGKDRFKMTAELVPSMIQDVLPGQDAAKIAADWNEGNWSIIEYLSSGAGSVVNLIYQPVLYVSMLLLVASISYMIATWRGMNPGRIAGWVTKILEKEEMLRAETVESVVRWKKRIDVRKNSWKGYRNQIAQANRDKSPLIKLGDGTGTMLFRGALAGYLPGQDVALSMDDTHQNILILGGTGSGKTFSVITPIIAQTIKNIKAGTTLDANGNRITQAIFATCGKGVLWQDVQELANKNEMECRIIGCKDGQYGVDLFGGLEPHIVSSTLNAIMSQVSGNRSSDPFWMQMACQIVDAATRIARAWEVTEGGIEYVKKTRERIYSPVGVYALARSVREPDGLLYRAIEDITTAYEEDPESIAVFCTPDLWSACELLRKDMPNFPGETLGSFLSNVTNMMNGFTSLHALRKSFGGCSGSNIIDISTVFKDGSITAVDLSQNEWGDAGRICNIFVKTRIYHMAASRQLKDNTIGKREKLLFVMDECQDLMTAGGGGYSETTFLNKSRSTGMSFLCGTQTLAAMYQAFGEAAGGQTTKNLVDQFRTKIFLAAEGQETIGYMQELAGTAMRSTVADFDQYESFFAERMENNKFSEDVDYIKPFELSESEVNEIIVNFAERQEVDIATKKMVSIENDFSRFFRADFRGGNPQSGSPAVDMTEKLKSIIWRAEDKRKAMMTEGKSDENLIQTGDLISGRGLAFAYIQRAGGVKMDIIELHPERHI